MTVLVYDWAITHNDEVILKINRLCFREEPTVPKRVIQDVPPGWIIVLLVHVHFVGCQFHHQYSQCCEGRLRSFASPAAISISFDHISADDPQFAQCVDGAGNGQTYDKSACH